jgi:hypothetical protein
MRKAIFVVSAICVVALLGGLVVAATASTDLSSPRTITVIEKQTQSHFVDLGRRGPSLGDYFVFSGVLRHAGNRVGYDGGQCTFVHTRPFRAECEATAKLGRGKITQQGLISLTNGARTFIVAVNGGTGGFRNARGQATIQDLSQTKSKITFHLIP